jgi:general secretion pathway protein D
MVELNFKNLDINDFITMVAKITNKNILVTYPLSGKVNFIAVKPVNEKEVYDILLNVLRSKGWTLVEDNGFLKVVRSADAVREAPPLFQNNNINQLETDIIPLRYIQARNAFTQVAFLLSRYGKIIINSDKNMLIITDYPKNLQIIKQILKKVDTENKKEIVYVKLKNNKVNKIYKEIVDISNNLFDKKIYKYSIIPDADSNTFVLIGSKNIVNTLKTAIEKLDVAPKFDQITKIITLNNSDVTEVSKVLNSVIKDRFTNVKQKPSITSDKETNSIIVIGKKEEIDIIESIIKALDVPKQQVYVKARILEISNTKASKIGAELGLLAGSGTASGIYTMSANLGGPALAFNPTDLGLTIPTLRQGLALGATLDLLETFGAAKKLSEPSILCINNTPSTIYVGKTVSVLTGKTTSTSTSESYSRQDIGLTLKITPRIDSDDKVSLKVESKIEDILPGSVVGLPTTSKREISTTTIVNNGQSIIIGGLVKDNKNVTLQKVPLLGDIPVLGSLFRHKEVDDDKTTLVILLTPYIVKTSDDLNKLRNTLVKLDELESKFVKKIIKKKKLNIKLEKKKTSDEFNFIEGTYENN